MNFNDLWAIMRQLLGGAAYTILVTLTCFLTGIVVGLAVTALRRLALKWVNLLLDGFIFIFRGVPALVLIFLVYFGLSSIGFKIEPIVAMNLSVGFIAGAYLAEVFRGALQSIDEAELLAAMAMGMSRAQIFVHIEFPQMFRFAFPGMVNEFTNVLKNSAFAYTIGISEIINRAVILTSTMNLGVEIYTMVGILYLLIYCTCLFCIRIVEKKSNFSAGMHI